MRNTQSQESMLLDDLNAGLRITPLEALEKYGCFRLGARIFQLRQSGYKIKSEMIRFGDKRVAQYSMEANVTV